MIWKVLRHGSERLRIFSRLWLALMPRKCCLVLTCYYKRMNTYGIIHVREQKLMVLRLLGMCSELNS